MMLYVCICLPNYMTSPVDQAAGQEEHGIECGPASPGSAQCAADTDPKARFPLCLPPLLSRAPVLLGRKSTQARGCLRSGQDQKVENTRAAEKKSDKSTIKTLRDRSLGPAPTASPRAGSRAGTCGGRAVLGTPGRPPHLLRPNPTGLCAREEWVKRNY